VCFQPDLSGYQGMAMAFVLLKFASAAVGKFPEPLRRRLCSPVGRRMLRFAPAALLALAASQVSYFLCASVLHETGRVTGAAGWLAGAAVSYAASRWAWERRGRPRLFSETLPFVAISLVAGPLLIEASHLGYREAATLGLHGVAFYAFVQGFYLAANGVTFIVRFAIFNFVVFSDRRPGFAWLYGRFRQLLPELARFSVVGACAVVVSGAHRGRGRRRPGDRRLLPGPPLLGRSGTASAPP
jgi:putative flippase GtrA